MNKLSESLISLVLQFDGMSSFLKYLHCACDICFLGEKALNLENEGKKIGLMTNTNETKALCLTSNRSYLFAEEKLAKLDLCSNIESILIDE